MSRISIARTVVNGAGYTITNVRCADIFSVLLAFIIVMGLDDFSNIS